MVQRNVTTAQRNGETATAARQWKGGNQELPASVSARFARAAATTVAGALHGLSVGQSVPTRWWPGHRRASRTVTVS